MHFEELRKKRQEQACGGTLRDRVAAILGFRDGLTFGWSKINLSCSCVFIEVCPHHTSKWRPASILDYPSATRVDSPTL